MNPGPAPRPPTDRPRMNTTQSLQTLPSSMSSLPSNGSTISLVQRTKTTEGFGGADVVVKEGPAKVKEEGGIFKSLVWNDRFLVLREHQLEFLKSQNSTKVASSINLRDVTNITRSEIHQFSFEISRLAASGAGASPPRDGPTKSTICKVETENDVYAWIDAIYPRCPGMGGVSNPTNFTHRVHVGFDPVSGAFTGLPQEWERLLNASAITKEDYQKHPDVVVEVLNFFTEKMMKRADDPMMYSSLTPTPPVEAANRQLGYSNSGSSIAGPRPNPPVQRQNTFDSTRSDSFSPMSEKSAYGMSSDREQSRLDDERRRRMEDEIRRKREQEKREQERRDREEQSAYNAAIPKARTPMAQQEIGGYGGAASSSSSGPRYNPARPAPSTPTTQRAPPASAQPRPNLQAQRPAPPKPAGQSGYGAAALKSPQSLNGQRPQVPASKYAAPAAAARPANGADPRAVQAPKPLNVQTKAAGPSEAVKKAEQALTRKDDGPSTRKEVRMSSMSEAEVMTKLREVVSKERPSESYNKQKKIGQGASGSVYVARIRENPTSPMARKILRENGPKAQVAIKQMDLRNQPRKELIVNEIIVMKDSKHENIVNFLDAFLQEDQSELWVVMEFMEGGALTDIIDNNPSIGEDQISTVCLEVSTCFRLQSV
jgi:serine/threonine-protein kinase CLA4